MSLTPLLVVQGLEKLHKNLIVKIRVEYTAWVQAFVFERAARMCFVFVGFFFFWWEGFWLFLKRIDSKLTSSKTL